MSEAKDKWEYYGENDPYFAVSTFDRFKAGNLDEAGKTEFFDSGSSYVERIWNEIEECFHPGFRPGKALDFGCGVGRLVIPLAARSEAVVGVDISEKMLAEAKRNCSDRGIDNAEFMQTDEFLSAKGLRFDLIHSVIVFQHIKPETGVAILEKMLDGLTDDGIGVLHFTYTNAADERSSLRFRLYRDYPFVYRIRNLLLRRANEPLIPMYLYDLNKIFLMLHDNGCHKCVVRFSHHGVYGALIFFQKRKKDLF
jgi:SAM-dependent methyltransferase